MPAANETCECVGYESRVARASDTDVQVCGSAGCVMRRGGPSPFWKTCGQGEERAEGELMHRISRAVARLDGRVRLLQSRSAMVAGDRPPTGGRACLVRHS